MAQELERISRVTQLAAAGRFRRSGKIITRDLRKKEKFGTRNWLWAYNDLIGMALGLLLMAFAIDILISWSSHTIVTICEIVAIFASIAIVTLCGILCWYRSGTPAEGHLSHSERIDLIRTERSRVKAPHAHKRRRRQPELDFNYPQYSVDVNYDKKDDQVILRLLKHEPWKDGRYTAQVYRAGKDEFSKIEGFELEEGVQRTAIRHITLPVLSTNGELEKTAALVINQQAIMEALADALEESDYQIERNRLMGRRIALTARR